MLLEDFMQRFPKVVAPDDTLIFATELMTWADARHLPVVLDGKQVVGILSDRDILAFRARNPDRSVQTALVAEAMHERPETIHSDASLTEASARLAASKIGCLPVVERGELVGLVTATDVLAAEARTHLEPHNSDMPVSEVMTRDPLTTNLNAHLLDAAALMSNRGVRHLPVLDVDGNVVGMLSDRDVRAAIRNPRGRADMAEMHLLVRHAMSSPAVEVDPNESCADVAANFAHLGVSAVPVVDKGRLVGILSYVDLLRGFARREGRAV